jgi:hypothetical protein
MADVVYLKWMEGAGADALVFKSAHLNVKDAQSQADAESKNYLGVFDGLGPDAKKLADAGGSGT